MSQTRSHTTATIQWTSSTTNALVCDSCWSAVVCGEIRPAIPFQTHW